MRKVIVCLVVAIWMMMLAVGSALALGDVNTNTNTNVSTNTNANANTNLNANTNTNLNTNIQGQQQGQIQGQQQGQVQGQVMSGSNNASQSVSTERPYTNAPQLQQYSPDVVKLEVYDNTAKIGVISGVIFYTNQTITKVLKVEKYGTYGGMINRWEVAKHILNKVKSFKVVDGYILCVRVTGRGVVKTYNIGAEVGVNGNPTNNSGGASEVGVSFTINMGDEFNVIEYLECVK
jgi:hypothetical protein